MVTAISRLMRISYIFFVLCLALKADHKKPDHKQAACTAADHIDIRCFGASTAENCNETFIQKAISAAFATGPNVVLIPAGTFRVCGPIQVPTSVHLVGVGWPGGGAGSELQAAHWNPNAHFPFNMMVWMTGTATPGVYFQLPNGGQAIPVYDTTLEHFWVNCNSQPNCGGVFRMGAQESSGTRNLVIGNFTYMGLFDEGVNCQGAWNVNPGVTAPRGCLLNLSMWGSGEELGDENVFVYPASGSTAVSYWLEGIGHMTTLTGTINCSSRSVKYAAYISGSNVHVGRLHVEGCGSTAPSTAAGAIYLGVPPEYLKGQDMALYGGTFDSVDVPIVIPNNQSFDIKVLSGNSFDYGAINRAFSPVHNVKCSVYFWDGKNELSTCGGLGDSAANTQQQGAEADGCTTGAANGSTCTVSITWHTAYPNTNYYAVCSGSGIVTGHPEILGLSKSAGGTVVTVRNGGGDEPVPSSWSKIDCVAIGR
ncbi:MAG TPA: hypothetical protein VFA65_05070 [Bryobacteraceae bacterium]|nr:hypothetical protein [Bryobacteraceae bacterium]